MNRIRDLIRMDLITMNGGKNNMKSLAIISTLLMLLGGFFVSPLFGAVITPLTVAGFFPLMIFQNEIRYHAEKLPALLPVRRRDLVTSRFLMMTGLYAAVIVICYLVMLISMLTGFYKQAMNGEDLLSMLAQKTQFTEYGLFHLAVCIGAAAGLKIISITLKQYFSDSSILAAAIGVKDQNGKKNKRRAVSSVIIIAVTILIMLVLSGLIPIGPAFSLILEMLKQLAVIADGWIFGIVVLAAAGCSAFYDYVCTVLSYDEKEI